MNLLNDPLGIFYINWYKKILYENCYFTDKEIFFVYWRDCPLASRIPNINKNEQALQ